jgi:hypothetical protein
MFSPKPQQAGSNRFRVPMLTVGERGKCYYSSTMWDDNVFQGLLRRKDFWLCKLMLEDRTCFPEILLNYLDNIACRKRHLPGKWKETKYRRIMNRYQWTLYKLWRSHGITCTAAIRSSSFKLLKGNLGAMAVWHLPKKQIPKNDMPSWSSAWVAWDRQWNSKVLTEYHFESGDVWILVHPARKSTMIVSI